MKAGTKDEIIEEIRKSIDRHQCSRQRYQQLKLALGKSDSRLVGDALLSYWQTLRDPDGQYTAQQFVASLLFALNPVASLSLIDMLRGLSRWNLSVEEFPWYLAMRFGKDQVLRELQSLESMFPNDKVFSHAADTVRFWLQADYVLAQAQYIDTE